MSLKSFSKIPYIKGDDILNVTQEKKDKNDNFKQEKLYDEINGIKFSNIFDIKKIKSFTENQLDSVNISPEILSNNLNNLEENMNLIKNKINLNLLKHKPIENFNEDKSDEDDDYSSLFLSFDSVEKFNSYYIKNKVQLENNFEILLLFLDYFTDFCKKNKHNILIREKEENKTSRDEFNIFVAQSNTLIDNIVIILEEKLLTLDPFLLISLIESLYKIKYFSNNKIWVKLEYILLRTNLLRNISIDFYYIILKAFECFFNREDSTILADEIFEVVEYNTILISKDSENENPFKKLLENFKGFENYFFSALERFKKEGEIFTLIQASITKQTNRINNNLNQNILIINNNSPKFKSSEDFCEIENFHLKYFFNICEMYYCFAKNLEGSQDLYRLFIEKFFNEENIQIFKNIFFCFVLENDHIHQRSDKIQYDCKLEIINSKLFECLINLYFSSILIYDNVCNKNFIIDFIKKIEHFILEIFMNLEKHLNRLLNDNIMFTNNSDSVTLYLNIDNKIFHFNNCIVDKLKKKYFFFSYNEFMISNIMKDETRTILLWSLSKRNIIKDNDFLINILSK